MDKLQSDLLAKWVQILTTNTFISLFRLVLKHNGGWRYIYNLLHPLGRGINQRIPCYYGYLLYLRLQEIYDIIVASRRGCLIIKRDIKDAFYMVPVAPYYQPLLGFEWDGVIYVKYCLLFGLATAPFLFNLFAEGL